LIEKPEAAGACEPETIGRAAAAGFEDVTDLHGRVPVGTLMACGSVPIVIASDSEAIQS